MLVLLYSDVIYSLHMAYVSVCKQYWEQFMGISAVFADWPSYVINSVDAGGYVEHKLLMLIRLFMPD